ncbi:MAG: hypothetical protein U0840_01515 [Gemmataceae bacterium]
MRMQRGVVALILMAVIGLVGCGKKDHPRSEVTGEVKFNGKLVPVGTVSFVGKGNNVVESAQLKEGKYVIARAPVGEVSISIVTPAPPPPGQMKQKVEGKTMESGAGAIVQVPGKYADAASSGLTYTVKNEKSQTYNIELK